MVAEAMDRAQVFMARHLHLGQIKEIEEKDMRVPQMDSLSGHRLDPVPVDNSAQERSGRSLSRDRKPTMGSITPALPASIKRISVNPKPKGADAGPAISSADLDQLMMDFDLNEPLDEPITSHLSKATTVTAAPATNTTTAPTDSKIGGLASSLGGLTSGLSSLTNPMGKLGEMASANPVSDVVSKGKDFLFKRFGL